MEERIKFWKTKTRRNASSISKIKVNLKYPPDIGEYADIKMHSKINEILISIENYNKISKSTAAKLIKEEKLKNAKENIIISLREDLEYHKKIKKHYLLYKQYATDICNYYKQNFDEILKYKSDLATDLGDFVTVVEAFEDQINQCKKDREIMIKTNNDILKYKNQEKQKMNDKINKLNYDLEVQKIELDKINATLNDYHSQNDNYIDKLNTNELDHIQRYEILEEKYNKLQSQYEVYFNMEIKRRKMELDYQNENLCRDEKDKIDLVLQDKIVQNNFLKEIANEIKNQINEIEILNQKTAEEEKMIRFLGKAFYKKFKQRHAKDNEKSKEKNLNKSKSRSKINIRAEKSKSRSKSKSKSRSKSKGKPENKTTGKVTMTKNPGLSILVNQFDFKNKNKNNFTSTSNISNNKINVFDNNIKDTFYTSYKNTRNNKFSSTTTGTA